MPRKTLDLVLPKSPEKMASIAYFIISFHDAPHLERLIRKLHMPWHLLVIHIDLKASDEHEKAVRDIASSYSNIFVVKTDKIYYLSDSTTWLILRFMRWLQRCERHIDFDYVIPLDSAVYPLWSAEDLATRLKKDAPRFLLSDVVPEARRVTNIFRQTNLIVSCDEGYVLLGPFIESVLYLWGNEAESFFVCAKALVLGPLKNDRDCSFSCVVIFGKSWILAKINTFQSYKR